MFTFQRGFHVGDGFDVDGNFFDVNVNFLFMLRSDININFMNCKCTVNIDHNFTCVHSISLWAFMTLSVLFNDDVKIGLDYS